MARHGVDERGIEIVDYDTEYGLLADDATAGCLLEAAEYFGPDVDADDWVAVGEGRGAAPTPDPSPEGEGDDGALPAPLLFRGGAGGGGGAADLSAQTRTPQRPGPDPLLTRPLQAQFCEHLARHGNVRLACRAARVSAQSAYRMRRACGQFRALWDAALVIAREQVEDVLADRAIHGWEEAVFYHGEEVARRRRYDSRLLLAHLARLDKLAERAAGGMVERFDEALDVLSADGDLAGLSGGPAQAAGVPAEAGTSGSIARDCGRPRPSLGLSEEDGVPAEAGTSGGEAPGATPLLEAQLCWLDEHYGVLEAEEEMFHLLHTVPGVPGSALRRFGWAGSEADLAADRARWAARRAVWEGDQVRVPAAAGTSGSRAEQLSPAAARC